MACAIISITVGLTYTVFKRRKVTTGNHTNPSESERNGKVSNSFHDFVLRYFACFLSVWIKYIISVSLTSLVDAFAFGVLLHINYTQ